MAPHGGKRLTDDAWIDAVRIAREVGSVSALLPEGCSSLLEAPHPFVERLQAALVVIGFDELEEDERPPRHIWFNQGRLVDWFENVVKPRRKAKYGGDGRDPIEDPVDNDAARQLIADG